MGGVGLDSVAGDEPVEEHVDPSQVLLDGRLGVGGLEVLDEGGDHYRLDGPEVGDAAVLTPAEESDGVAKVGPSGVQVLDGDGEVFGEARDGVVAGRGEDGREDDLGGRCQGPLSFGAVARCCSVPEIFVSMPPSILSLFRERSRPLFPMMRVVASGWRFARGHVHSGAIR